MKKIISFLSGLFLGGCVAGATVLDRDAGHRDDDALSSPCEDAATPPPPPPVLCTAPTLYPVGSWGSPRIGPPPIVIEPNAVLAGEVTIVSVERTDHDLALTIDDQGTTRVITVNDTRWPLDVTPGDVVIARSIGTDSWPGPGTHVLVLREPTGALVAAYVREPMTGSFEQNTDLGALLHVDAHLGVSCVMETGGQCGRGVQQYALVVGNERAAQGESFATSTLEGDIEIGVISVYDDGYAPADLTVCAIGSLGGVAVDARPAPAAL